MDWLQVHLALNHVPVIGTPFLLLLLVWGLFRRNAVITRLALWWLVWFAGLSIALKFTGDFAAEQVGSKLDPVRSWVDLHEQAADRAVTAVFLLGLAAALALFFSRGGRPTPKWTLVTVFILTLLTCVMFARTAHVGGQIGHPELRPSGTNLL